MRSLFFPLLLLFSTSAFASPCDQFFPNHKEIVVPNTVVICHSFYASVYDTKHEANIFSTESVQAKKHVVRVDSFKPDPRVVNSPTPEDYTNTGFDRGHMTPAADSNSSTEMSDTFYMTNMTPQYPNVNRIAWKNLEESVRKMNYATILTGAIYNGYTVTIGKHKIPVPAKLYKVVYLTDGSIKSFWADNLKTNKTTSEVDLTTLEKFTSLNLH